MFDRLIYIVGRLSGKVYICVCIQIVTVYINLDIIEWPNDWKDYIDLFVYFDSVYIVLDPVIQV